MESGDGLEHISDSTQKQTLISYGNQFKNIERLRYKINKDNNSRIEREKDNAGNITISFFSCLLSALITELLSKQFIVKDNIKALLFGIFGIIIIYVTLYFVIKKSYPHCIKIIGVLIHHKNKNADNAYSSDVISDFDNIACDSLMVSYSFMNEYKVSYNNSDIMYCRYCYFEMLHYLIVAYNKTQPVVENSTNYIGLFGGLPKSVDIYRIFNVFEIMEIIKQFLNQHIDDISTIEEIDFKKLINNQLEKINIIELKNIMKKEDICDKIEKS